MNTFTGIDHDGETYEPRRDRVRLNAQTQRVFDAMSDGAWRTLRQHKLRWIMLVTLISGVQFMKTMKNIIGK